MCPTSTGASHERIGCRERDGTHSKTHPTFLTRFLKCCFLLISLKYDSITRARHLHRLLPSVLSRSSVKARAKEKKAWIWRKVSRSLRVRKISDHGIRRSGRRVKKRSEAGMIKTGM